MKMIPINWVHGLLMRVCMSYKGFVNCNFISLPEVTGMAAKETFTSAPIIGGLYSLQ